MAGSHIESSKMTATVSEQIIDFFAKLQGVDRLQTPLEKPRNAVIDLNTAAIIEAHPDYPDGEVLMYERMEQLFVRHAYEMSITEGSSVKEQYQHISEHFILKTGYGQ
jgi:hypothetical protein